MYFKTLVNLSPREVSNAAGNLAMDAEEKAFDSSNRGLWDKARALALSAEILHDSIVNESPNMPYLVEDVSREYEIVLKMFEAI